MTSIAERERQVRASLRPTSKPIQVGVCAECGEQFVLGKKRRFCSMACSDKASGRAAGARRVAVRRGRGCASCRGPIEGKARFCATCSIRRRESGPARWASRAKPCATCGRARRSSSEVCGKCLGVARRRTIPCPRCGTDFWPWANGRSHARKFCGTETCVAPKRVRLGRLMRPERECAKCAKAFTPKSDRQACCSKVCRTRYQSAKRKLRLRGLTPVVFPVARIHRRDSGICGLCSKPVDLTLAYPHPLSATLDHIVPVSVGGAHNESNLQLAHARCNISKGNRIGAGLARVLPMVLGADRKSVV